MINFKIDICPRCGKRNELMYSNNPLSASSICFDCINKELDYNNIEHAEFFCRTYNLSWNPDLWLSLVSEYEDDTFRQYTRAVLDNPDNKPNLYYAAKTHDLWSKTNKE